MTPERPCTAYFQASVFADSAAVFDALKAQGFAASSVRCLQRRPTGEMLITFSSAHMKKAFVEKNSIQISQRRYAINDSDRFLTYLNIYDAPPELSDNAIIKRLEPFCEVVSYCRGRYPRNKLVFNGNRHFRVRINAAIPSYLRFGKFLIRLSHDGQQHTCRRCNQRGHFANDCDNTICFNCDEIGHVAETCPNQELCCICKEPSHRACFCPYSWFRLESPQTSFGVRLSHIHFISPPRTSGKQSRLLRSPITGRLRIFVKRNPSRFLRFARSVRLLIECARNL